ncbi:MAG: hypothetical protein R2854_02350 [Caldilineaceae bacterium]
MPNLLPVFTNGGTSFDDAAPNFHNEASIFFSNVSDVLTGLASGEDATINISLELEDLTGLPVGAP